MRPWKLFIPPERDLDRLTSISAKGIFASSNGDPVMGSIYLLGRDGDWISLSWDYADVQFKFEMYFIAVDHVDRLPPEDIFSIEDISEPSSMQFLLLTEWIRPAQPGEVPANFEQVLEESGTASSVPPSATAVGTSLYGIVLSDANSKPLLAITLDESEKYRLRCISTPEGIRELTEALDCCTYSQLLAWAPPHH